MTRQALPIIALTFITLCIGCASNPPTSAPGLASLTIAVSAEPNPKSAKTASGVGTYGGPENAPRQLTPVDYDHLDGIVVWLESATSGATSPEAITIALREWSSESEAQVRGASIGAQVTVENKTRQPQTIFSVSRGNEFNLASIAPGATGTFTVRSAGEIEILAESIPDPIAVVCAVRSTFVRTTSASNTVRFSNLAPGEYTARCWTNRLPGSSAKVTLAPDREEKLSLKVGVTQLPKK
jgi:hypothetical protein